MQPMASAILAHGSPIARCSLAWTDRARGCWRPLGTSPDIKCRHGHIRTQPIPHRLRRARLIDGEPKQMTRRELMPALSRSPNSTIAGEYVRIPVTRHRAPGIIARSLSPTTGVFLLRRKAHRPGRAGRGRTANKAALSVGISPEPDLGHRLVRGRHRRAGDGHHVGRALGRVLRAADHRAEGAAGADPGRLHLDPRAPSSAG